MISDPVQMLSGRIELATLPTPLVPAPNLSRSLGINLLFKRDDLTGLAMGGNKARQLEYLVADALAQNATMILATAAAQSNFCRMMAAATRRVGLRAGLLLRGTIDAEIQGNLLLNHLLGAEIRFIDNYDPYHPIHQQQLSAWAAEEAANGEQPYIVDLHNGSRMGSLMTCGYVSACLEISNQLRHRDLVIDHLYVAVGSGSTLAGLSIGSQLPGSVLSRTRIVGVSVGTPSEVIVPKVREFVRSTTSLLRLPVPNKDLFTVDDSHRGRRYGESTDAGNAAAGLVAQSEALLLNPVYTSKAFSCLLSDVENGTIRPGATVVFLNTGGDPLIFAYADELARTSRHVTPSS